MKSTAQEAAHHFKNPQKNVTENVNKAKEQFQKARQQMPKARKEAAEKAKQTAENAKTTADKLGKTADQAKKTAQEAQKSVSQAKQTFQQTRQAGRQTLHTAKQSVRTGQQAERTIKTTSKTAKSTAKGTIKTVKKSVKTAERTAKTTVKTAKQTAKAAQKSAQAAAKAAKIAAQVSKAAAKAAVQAAKVAAKAVVAMVKAAIAAIKGLVALIAAGGWIAVIIIIVICLIGLLVGSVFGIFFSGEDSGNGYTMPMAIAEINQDYSNKLTEIRNSNAHDEVQMSGTRAEWKEILAVYAVKTNSDPDNPTDVATMDDNKKELLRTVFWDMNTLANRTERKTVTEVTVVADGENFISTETTVTKTILYITVSHKTADEMAVQYGFNDSQKAQLVELLNDQYADMWTAVLYGIHNGSGDIVAVAVSQLGNVNGDPYWSWYGFDSRVEWCATFVSWCANECGYIDAGIIPKFAACQSQGISWFKDRGLWQEPSYIPAIGDIIFFDWEPDGSTDHVGIVESVEGEIVHTIEGNTTNSVARRSYRLDSMNICGYGTPLY
ncbi:MAG: hypothetical protein A2Y17_13380 [Clostridiales bacterium GWF2_38_85]|nr:MAG: hypothetical protein A2Y17_13380 [Clostridiales bacterium GWF2_38_85]